MAHQLIADAEEALSSLDDCLRLVASKHYVPNGAEYTRWLVDDLDEAVRGLHELLADESTGGRAAAAPR